jgi:acetylornithine deacetylase/succinyl-diaminopimelate desuccinylase-like protein
MSQDPIARTVETTWNETIVPTLTEYIKIPNKSPQFDPQWVEHGHMDRAVDLVSGWCKEQRIEGLQVQVVRLEGRTPLIYMEIPGRIDATVMLYGHLDKQPEMTGWSEGLGPWTPVLRDGRLYGRGGADDGYAAFASLTAISALQQQGIDHARCVVLIEGCEESGSYDLPHYIQALSDRIGDVSLVICLDSGCGNYDQLWATTSLRGMVAGTLRVELLREGVHSGDASGVVPSSFRILRQILGRLENMDTGEILPREFHVEIPGQRRAQAELAAQVLGRQIVTHFPFLDGVKPVEGPLDELVINRTWRPALAVTGQEGMPPLESAGNVLRPYTALKLSLRLPPTTDAEVATRQLSKLLTEDPPYGAKVTFEGEHPADGWNAPELAPWLEASVDAASKAFFGKPALYMGEGGSIPFMGMLGAKYPKAQFLITGVLGPGSNAHGPNEFLDIATGKRLTSCVSRVLADHGEHFRGA